MKLIIDIPEEEYKRLKGYIPFGIGEMLKNGTPFYSVIEDIKAEIENRCAITVNSNNEPAMTLHDIFEIIDRHIGDTKC